MRYVIREPADLGTAVAEFRTLRGLSQAALAERIDVHRSYLSNLEQGPTTTAIERLIAALTALDVEIVIREKR